MVRKPLDVMLYQSDRRGDLHGELSEGCFGGGAGKHIGGAGIVPGHEADLVLDRFLEVVGLGRLRVLAETDGDNVAVGVGINELPDRAAIAEDDARALEGQASALRSGTRKGTPIAVVSQLEISSACEAGTSTRWRGWRISRR